MNIKVNVQLTITIGKTTLHIVNPFRGSLLSQSVQVFGANFEPGFIVHNAGQVIDEVRRQFAISGEILTDTDAIELRRYLGSVGN
jgi:hypothetical protein